MYKLRFRFRVPPDRVITSQISSKTLASLAFSLSAEPELPGSYAINVDGFASSEEASAYLSNIRAGLLWLLLQQGVAADAAFDEVQVVAHPANTGTLPTWIDGARPAVYPTGMKLQVLTGLAPQITIALPSHAALDLLTEAAQFPHFERLADDKKLIIALDLYRAHFTESSLSARFLTLITALEAMTEGKRVGPNTLNLIDKWQAELTHELGTVDENSEEERSLKSLQGTLSNNRDGSIKSRVRRLVLSTLQNDADPDAERFAYDVGKIYDVRSRLLHDGELEDREELGQANTKAKEIVNRVLKIRFLNVVWPRV